uniref:CDK5 regulatory subunit associated protein 3 n=1 Tax=Sinocyclocheilus rhinocerous TaxID=307959 RepID=A0A673LIJ1_9TELE
YQSIQNLPIDIQTSKILYWLVDRRHCTLKWQSAVMTIREKINAAIQDMPENEEIKQLLSGSCIHYCHCLRIIEILKRNRSIHQNFYFWQIFITKDEGDGAFLCRLVFF